jgi:hypothetical protein
MAPIFGCDGDSADLQPGNGAISVRVVDGDQAVADVEIQIAGSGQTLTTDSTGEAFFEVAAGDYFVDAEVCCVGPENLTYHVPVTVKAGRTVEVTLHACLACVCSSPDTPIATPYGETPIHALKAGDLVYSRHRGRVVAVPVLATNNILVQDHCVVRVLLSSGTILEISPGHPTADGRTFADLQVGERIGNVTILNLETVPYSHDRTYDILPDSDSGVYYSGGIPIGSTLSEFRPLVAEARP